MERSEKFEPIHIELLSGEGIRFKEVWPPLEKGIEQGKETKVRTNVMGFEYAPETGLVHVFVTFSDGSDEIVMAVDVFRKALEQHTIGGASC